MNRQIAKGAKSETEIKEELEEGEFEEDEFEPDEPEGTETALFRQEAIAEQRSQWLGTVLMAPSLSSRVFTLFAAASTIGIAALLFLGNYTQKSRISGWLVPDLGMMRVYAPKEGRIVKLHVQEGDTVKPGAPLALLSGEVESEAHGFTRQATVQQLVRRRESLIAERQRQERLFVLEEKELTDQVAALNRVANHLTQELSLQRSRLELAEQESARQQGLRTKGIVTVTALQEAERDRLRIAGDVQALSRDVLNNVRERMTSEARLRELPLSRDSKLGEIDRDASTLAQELMQTEEQREIVITAPQDGIVTSVRGTLGGSVRSDSPLLNIMPTGSKLIAELFTTSRAIGFVQPGQEVLLRYSAFPYQKFGTYRGTVKRISRSAVSPSELSPQLAGLSSMFGSNEPVYRIEVEPEKQSAIAYGVPAPLQVGMQLEADILIERRRLYEWMLDPVYTLTGRWRS